MPHRMYEQLKEWRHELLTDMHGYSFDAKDEVVAIGTTSEAIAVRKQKTYRIGGHANINLEWWEFVDRRAKAKYWQEVLRREAWEATPPKEK